MLNIMHSTARDLLLEFNVNKSYCIAFGPNIDDLPSLNVGCKPFCWCSTVKYLGIHLVSGKCDTIERFYCTAMSSRCTRRLLLLQILLQNPFMNGHNGRQQSVGWLVCWLTCACAQ